MATVSPPVLAPAPAGVFPRFSIDDYVATLPSLPTVQFARCGNPDACDILGRKTMVSAVSSAGLAIQPQPARIVGMPPIDPASHPIAPQYLQLTNFHWSTWSVNGPAFGTLADFMYSVLVWDIDALAFVTLVYPESALIAYTPDHRCVVHVEHYDASSPDLHVLAAVERVTAGQR